MILNSETLFLLEQLEQILVVSLRKERELLQFTQSHLIHPIVLISQIFECLSNVKDILFIESFSEVVFIVKLR